MSFRRKERFVDMLAGIDAHAFAGVCYGDPNAMVIGPPIGSWPHPDFELAAARHGLNSITDQVDKNLTHLSCKAHKFRRIFCSGVSGTESAGINRHIVGDARAPQERRSDSILASSLACGSARKHSEA